MNRLELAGKHRGIVVDNADPLKLGRLKIRVEAAYGLQPVRELPWAWPCFPAGGSANCGFFSVPEKGAGVWVEFQWKDGEPDPAHPVWSGIWLGEGDTPREVEGPPEDAHYYTVLKSANARHALVFCDKPGNEYIRIVHSETGHFIEWDPVHNIVVRSTGGTIKLN